MGKPALRRVVAWGILLAGGWWGAGWLDSGGCTAQAARGRTETTGDFLQLLLPVMAYGMAYQRGDIEGKRQLFQGYLTTAVATELLKEAVPKARPNGAERSFVSGHTSSAFAGAAFIQMRYGWGYGAPAYLAAAYTGYSRVFAEKHFWNDVGRGAGIAILSAWFFTTPQVGVTLTPFAVPGGGGLTLRTGW